MKTLLFMTLFVPLLILGQNKVTDTTGDNYESVKKAVTTWADSTFRYYENVRLKNFRVIYSDDYLIAQLRLKNLERDLKKLKAKYESGTFEGTDEFYKRKYRMIGSRKQDAENNLDTFTTKVDRFYVIFCSNIKLVTGVFNYMEFKIFVDQQYRVVENTIKKTEEEKKNSKILFR